MAKKRNTRDYNKNYPCFAEGGADDYNTDPRGRRAQLPKVEI